MAKGGAPQTPNTTHETPNLRNLKSLTKNYPGGRNLIGLTYVNLFVINELTHS